MIMNKWSSNCGYNYHETSDWVVVGLIEKQVIKWLWVWSRNKWLSGCGYNNIWSWRKWLNETMMLKVTFKVAAPLTVYFIQDWSLQVGTVWVKSGKMTSPQGSYSMYYKFEHEKTLYCDTDSPSVRSLIVFVPISELFTGWTKLLLQLRIHRQNRRNIFVNTVQWLIHMGFRCKAEHLNVFSKIKFILPWGGLEHPIETIHLQQVSIATINESTIVFQRSAL